MNRRALAVAAGWMIVAAIVVASLAPMPDTGPDVPHQDKWGHLLSYGLLMAWFARLYPRPRTRWRYFAGFVALGAALELLQIAVPYRDGDALDLVADVIGLALGVAVARGLGRLGRAAQGAPRPGP